MKIILLSLSLIFTSCGKDLLGDDFIYDPESRRKFDKTNPELESYVTYVQNKVQDYRRQSINLKSIPVNFSNFDGNTIGVCRSYGSGVKEILIDERWWSFATECDKYVLILHEFGHCFWNRPHTNETKDNGYPSSIMNSSHIGGGTYCRNESYYLQELF